MKHQFVSGALALMFGVSVLLGVAAPAHADAVSDFKRAWTEAPDAQTRIEAIDALASTGSEGAVKTLLAVLAAGQGEPSALDHAIAALAGMQGTEGDEYLLTRLKKGKKWIERGLVARVLSRRRSSDAARAALIDGLKDREWQVQAACVRGLSRMPHKDSVDALIGLLKKLKGRVAEDLRLIGDVRDALYRLTGLKQGDAEDWAHWWEVKGAEWTPDDKEHALVEHESATVSRIPPLFEEVYSRRVIFVVDVSSSMKIATGGEVSEKYPEGLTRFQVMVRELKKIIASLPKEAKFNVIAYSDDSKVMSGKLVKASKGNKRLALKFCDRLAAFGATNSHGALKTAFADPSCDTIYFLSDGSPTIGKMIDTEKLVGEVQRWNLVRSVRIHTIAFLAGDGHKLGIPEGDKAIPKLFMEELAKKNDGRYRLID